MTHPDNHRPRVGCADIPAGVVRDRYMARLSFLELSRTYDGLPKTAALRRRRESAPEGFGFGLIAPRSLTARFEPDPAELDRLARACEALGAETVVFRCAPDFAPSARNRDRLGAFFDAVDPDRLGATPVWEPQGLWEPESAARMAEKLGVVLALDPLERDPTRDDAGWLEVLSAGPAYFRIRGLGASGSLATPQIEALSEIASAFDPAWVVFATWDAFGDASRLRKLVDPAD